VKLLLDSHAIWLWLTDSPKLPTAMKRMLIENPAAVHISIVSYYEIGLKQQRGRLPGHPLEMREALDADGFTELDVTAMHMVTASQLDWSHRDPWDRILAAQTIVEGCALVSTDKAFDAIVNDRLW